MSRETGQASVWARGILLFLLAAASMPATAQTEDAPLGEDVEEVTYLKPNAAFADTAAFATNSGLLNNKSDLFFQNASNLTSGTLSSGRLAGTYNISISGNAATATRATSAMLADDSLLLNGKNEAFFRNASNLNAGILNRARLAGIYDIDISGRAARATLADNSLLLNGKNDLFFQNASNLTSGTLNNNRLAADLGNRTIANARNADTLDGLDSSQFADRTELAPKTLASNRWYRIAVNGPMVAGTPCCGAGSTAFALFNLRANVSGQHQLISFVASYNYGQDPTITVISNSSFSTAPIRHVRVVSAGTYDGAAVEFYLQSSDGRNIVLRGQVLQNDNWSIQQFASGAVPAGFAATNIDLGNSTNFAVSAQDVNSATIRSLVEGQSFVTDATNAANAGFATNAGNANTLDGLDSTFFRNASNLNTGTLNNARLAADLGNRSIENARNAATATTATNAGNANTLDGLDSTFFRNASNLNTGTLNNARLAADLGARTIENARHADMADFADTSGSAQASGSGGGAEIQIGATGVFSRSSTSGWVSHDFTRPSGGTHVIVEVACETANNSATSTQNAQVDLRFDNGFTQLLTLCRAGINGGDVDLDRDYDSAFFEVPRNATKVTITQTTVGGDRPSTTSGSIYWMGVSGAAASGSTSGTLVASSGSSGGSTGGGGTGGGGTCDGGQVCLEP